MLNPSLKEKMKNILALASAAGITLVTTGCFFDYEKQNDDVAIQPVGYSSDVDSTTPKKEDSTSDFDPNTVTRLEIPQQTALRVVITDKKYKELDENDNIVNETTTVANDLVLGTYIHTDDNAKTTTAKEEKNYNNVTDVVYSTTKAIKPVTKVTTKVTLKTTKATKPTTKATTTTTTTTVPVTEPPVVETEPPVVEPELPPVGEYTIDGCNINDAMSSSYAASLFKNSLRGSLMKSDGGLLHISMPYGDNGEMVDTFCGSECTWLFVALNYNYASEKIYSGFSVDDIDINSSDFKTFIYNFGYVQSITGNDIDFTKYTCNLEVGQLLKEAQKAYREGYMDSFLYDKFVNGNISDECRNNPGVMGILCSYDTNHSYLNEDDVSNNYLNGFINHVYESTCGYSYSNSK